eukprot:CAMPEP_0205930866 /NCGR_PEP_ID=MMETSP1325-20131115/26233_1 /ASSEMBLY_ACC=CAM_ASM_000708 /TAXON_ID=236786 /ORGANISM="Florenciella sp., Strain RCC1007" /LENGTH=44 /DNA_ID= /DNA_START= /DNA_END= /DNA_ORIENTATION=
MTPDLPPHPRTRTLTCKLMCTRARTHVVSAGALRLRLEDVRRVP